MLNNILQNILTENHCLMKSIKGKFEKKKTPQNKTSVDEHA